MKLSTVGLLGFVLFSGCASQTKYVAPESLKVSAFVHDKSSVDTAVIERPQAVIIQKLTSGAQKINFTVDNVNQASGVVEIRYAGDPREYIDCGRVTSTVKTAKGERNYDFPAAKAYQQYQLQRDGKLYLIDRRMNVDIEAKITLTSLSPTRTRMRVDAQYTAIRDQSVQGGEAKPFGVTDKISFNLRENATFSNAATKCRATGRFELDLFAVAK